jgi:hypothetical protein
MNNFVGHLSYIVNNFHVNLMLHLVKQPFFSPLKCKLVHLLAILKYKQLSRPFFIAANFHINLMVHLVEQPFSSPNKGLNYIYVLTHGLISWYPKNLWIWWLHPFFWLMSIAPSVFKLFSLEQQREYYTVSLTVYYYLTEYPDTSVHHFCFACHWEH